MHDINKISISIAEAARASGLSKWTLYKLSAKGELPVYKIGNRTLVPLSEFKGWLEKHKRAIEVR